jgi:hypothetical protein
MRKLEIQESKTIRPREGDRTVCPAQFKLGIVARKWEQRLHYAGVTSDSRCPR